MDYQNIKISLIIFIIFINSGLTISVVNIKIYAKNPLGKMNHFWKSTGLCPPDPKSTVNQFLFSDQEKLNFALIGSLPNHGITQVRIHWLINAIRYENDELNFHDLDRIIDFLKHYRLNPGFELMGYPLDYYNKNDSVYDIWKKLSCDIASHYIDRYGPEVVSSWKFETWNEPDLKSYNVLNFTLPEYLHYVNGCAEGLKDAFKLTKRNVKLGGPAGLFKKKVHHPFCWGLLEACNSLVKSYCPIQFISFHRKGNGTVEGVLNGTLELLDLLHNKFPNLVEMPIANDECDIMQTWSKSIEYRGDVRYAAMIVKFIIDSHKSIEIVRKLKIEIFSNDNGFLNYHPFYFTQRTLFARFQMNCSTTPYNQFIKKPVYSAMALLSILGFEYLKQEINPIDPLLTILATRQYIADFNQSIVSVLMSYGDNQRTDITDKRFLNITVDDLLSGSKFVIYVLDNVHTNPYQRWKMAGSPVFPGSKIRRELRALEEPYRPFGPSPILGQNLNIPLNLSLPSVALIHICSKPSTTPGRITRLSIFNITWNEVLLTWSDIEVKTTCIRTYEIEMESTCNNSLQFQRVNINDTIFLSYHYAPIKGDGACEATIGRYRVRAVDYWDQKGRYSKIISYS